MLSASVAGFVRAFFSNFIGEINCGAEASPASPPENVGEGRRGEAEKGECGENFTYQSNESF